MLRLGRAPNIGESVGGKYDESQEAKSDAIFHQKNFSSYRINLYVTFTGTVTFTHSFMKISDLFWEKSGKFSWKKWKIVWEKSGKIFFG